MDARSLEHRRGLRPAPMGAGLSQSLGSDQNVYEPITSAVVGPSSFIRPLGPVTRSDVTLFQIPKVLGQRQLHKTRCSLGEMKQ